MKKLRSKNRAIIVAYWHDPRFKKKAGGLIRMFELADNLMRLGLEVTMVLPDLGFPQTQTHARVVTIPFVDVPLIRPLCFHLLSSLYLVYACRRRDLRFLYVRQLNSFLPLIISRFWGIFSYFEIPNDPYIGYSYLGKSKGIVVKMIDNLCMALSNRIVVLSEWSKKRLHTLGCINPEKVLVFPSGTDTNLFHPFDKQTACREVGLDPSLRYVGFIGSFLAYQGIDILINAAPSVREHVPDTRFLLVGDGPMRSEWGKMADKKGLKDYFIFTGHVPYRQVPAYLGAMDICVAPHHPDTNQASPVKLFDYMAAGRSIVASDLDVVREIIADSGCATIVPPNNSKALSQAIVTILSDPAKQNDMASKGRQYALSYYDRKHLTDLLFNKETEKNNK